MQSIQAIFQDGVFKPLADVDLPENTMVNLEFSPRTIQNPNVNPFDITAYVGKVKLGEDPLEFQKRIRSEWD